MSRKGECIASYNIVNVIGYMNICISYIFKLLLFAGWRSTTGAGVPRRQLNGHAMIWSHTWFITNIYNNISGEMTTWCAVRTSTLHTRPYNYSSRYRKKNKKKTIDNEKCNVSNANEHHFSSILMDLCSVESCCAMAMCMYRHGTEAHSRKNDYYVCVCVCVLYRPRIASVYNLGA